MNQRLAAILLSFAALFLTQCRHTDSTVSSDAEAALNQGTSCDQIADMMCTREYAPTACVFDRQEFKGSNPCEAKRLAQAYACKNNLAYDKDNVRCAVPLVEGKESPTPVLADVSPAPVAGKKDCSTVRMNCTREYNPHTCQSAGVSAEGSNLCEARLALQRSLCEKGLPYNASQMACSVRRENSVNPASGER